METAAVSAVPPYFGQSDLADAREISRLRQSHAVGVVADPSRRACLLYPSDAADDLPCVTLGGARYTTNKKQ